MILGITGKKGSGKDYIGRLIASKYENHKIVHFADPLKYKVAEFLGIHSYNFFNNNKNTKFYDFEKFELTDTPNENTLSLREILQKFGTDMVRNNLNDNYWINSLFKENTENLIIPDVRFISEAEAILDRGGQILKVVNPSLELNDLHKSETEMDHIIPDFIISNNPTCDEVLIEQLKKLKLWGKQ